MKICMSYLFNAYLAFNPAFLNMEFLTDKEMTREIDPGLAEGLN